MKGQGLKLISEEFRNNILQLKLKTPPDIVFGLINLEGSAIYEKYIDSLGKELTPITYDYLRSYYKFR